MPRFGGRRLQQLQLQKAGERYVLEPLEKVKNAWQDLWRLHRHLHRVGTELGHQLSFSNTGAVANFERLPDFLLSEHSLAEDKRAAQLQRMFVAPPELQWGHGRFVVPYMLSDWGQAGRRHYCLSDALNAILRTASLKEVKLADIRLPLPSFSLKISRPIPTPEGGSLDFFVVSGDMEESSSIGVMALDISRDQYQPLSGRQIKEMEEYQLRRDWPGLHHLITHHIATHFARGKPGMKLALGGTSLILDEQNWGKELVPQIANEISLMEMDYEGKEAGWREVFNQILQLVCGFALYMSALHPDNQKKHVQDAKRAPDRSGEPDRKGLAKEHKSPWFPLSGNSLGQDKRVL